MKIVIVYNHPYEKSFCHALLTKTKEDALKSGHEVDIIDLNSDGFNPVMRSEDLLGFIKNNPADSLVIEYINRIKQADYLVFIFPIYWELMPAMMKGFFDKVICPGSFFNYKKSGFGMYNLMSNLKKVTIITTMNTPKLIYRFIYGNALKYALIKGTFKKIGIKNVDWISFNMVKFSSKEKREKWLNKDLLRI